jgi:hypothetical protein
MRSRPRPERGSSQLLRRIAAAAAAILPVLLGAGAVSATTLVPVSFDDMVRASGTVVVARVASARTSEAVTPGYRPTQGRVAPGETRAPLARTPYDRSAAAPQGLPAPMSAGIKPGRLIVTQLTLVVEETIKGRAPATLILKVPGGTLNGTTLEIHGLPKFESGERYLLFLRPDAERVGDPVVGVNQGFFHVVPVRAGQPSALVTESGDFVLAVEENRLVVKAGPQRATERPAPAREPMPDPEMGFPSETGLSEVERRYWESTEPPMTVAAMAAAVHAVPGWDRVVPIGRPLMSPPSRTGVTR